MMNRRITIAAALLMSVGRRSLAQRAPSLADKITEIASRPELVHATPNVACTSSGRLAISVILSASDGAR